MPPMFDPRDDARTSGARSYADRALGPYETRYDTRRGYSAPAEAPGREVRHDGGEVWRGRGRDER